MNGNKIFKKGKSDVLTFKNNVDSIPAKAVPTKPKKPEVKIRKTYIGKGIHFFPKASIGQFLVEEDEIEIGDKILISGPTTGNQEITITEMFLDDALAQKAVVGEKFALKLPFRIRLSDKLYKLKS